MSTSVRFILVVIILASASSLLATPIIAVDLDPSSAGVQNDLVVNLGDEFLIDIVLQYDGAPFTSVFVDVLQLGSPTLDLLSPPIAGNLAGMSPFILGAFDALGGPTAPGSPLLAGPNPTPDTLLGGFGGAGLLSLGMPFAVTDPFVTIYSLSLRAGGSGDAVLSLGPEGRDDLMTLGGVPIEVGLSGATLTVGEASSVPEPSTLWLLGASLVLAVARRRYGRILIM